MEFWSFRFDVVGRQGVLGLFLVNVYEGYDVVWDAIR